MSERAYAHHGCGRADCVFGAPAEVKVKCCQGCLCIEGNLLLLAFRLSAALEKAERHRDEARAEVERLREGLSGLAGDVASTWVEDQLRALLDGGDS